MSTNDGGQSSNGRGAKCVRALVSFTPSDLAEWKRRAVEAREARERAKKIRAFITVTRDEMAEWRGRAGEAKARGHLRTGQGSVSGQIRLALEQTRRFKQDEDLRREVRDALHGVLLVIEMLEGDSCTMAEAAGWLREARAGVRAELLGDA